MPRYDIVVVGAGNAGITTIKDIDGDSRVRRTIPESREKSRTARGAEHTRQDGNRYPSADLNITPELRPETRPGTVCEPERSSAE